MLGLEQNATEAHRTRTLPSEMMLGLEETPGGIMCKLHLISK